MNNKKSLSIAAAVAISAISAISYTPVARAGDVTNAALACLVDTFAYDQLVTDYCASAWTPSTANNPTTAHFEVVGLATGSYSYSWSRSTCGNSKSCNVSIRKDTSGGTPITLTVTITDNATGAQKTVSATAEFIDAWN